MLKFNIKGVLLDEYSSIKEAAEMNNIVYTSISANLNGRNKTAAGFKSRYPLDKIQEKVLKRLEVYFK